MSTFDAVSLMINEEYNVIEALKEQKQNIIKAVDIVSEVLKENGRIIYIGAGTSGRIGLLDAVECPPTFGVDYNTVIGLIAGGEKAFIKAQENAEDSFENAQRDLQNINLTSKDIVIGIAASGRTPYVIGGLKFAKKMNCKTIAISCSKNAKISLEADMYIEAFAGAEILTGSTRLKSGTVQKIILNMISTLSMVKIGKVYKNYMIDLKPSNEKLVERSINIIMQVTDVDYNIAYEYFQKSNKSVKIAIVMILNNCNYKQAKNILIKNNNHIK